MNLTTSAAALESLREGVARMAQGSRGIADRVPVYAQISHHSARLAGKSSVAFFTEAQTFLRCELAADIFYEIDSPTIHYDVYNIESEAMGARLLWDEKQVPAIDPSRPLLTSVDAYESLRPIRMGAAGRMPYVLEINSRLMNMGLAPKVRFTGPITLAANLVGLQELIMAIAAHPDRVHRLMEFLVHEIVGPWILCQRQHCGSNETATGSDALASPPMLSVEMVAEFCLKYIRELEHKVGGIRLAGLWGESVLPDPVKLLEIKQAGSPGAIQALDPDASALGPAFFRRYANECGLALTMGLDANLIGAGPAADIVSRTRRFIEEGGRTGRFILFINDVPYDTPPENVHAVISTAREYRADPPRACYARTQADSSDRRWGSFDDAYRVASRMAGGASGGQRRRASTGLQATGDAERVAPR